MDKLKALSHTSSAKEDIKAHYQITLKKIDGLPKTWSNPLHISWKRGNKKENSGEAKSIPKEGVANIEHVISMDSTITKTNKGYQSKSLIITLKEEIKSLGPGKKPVLLGSCEINLAQYVESKTEKSNLFQIKDKSKPICNLYVNIQSSWLKINGKSLVKVDNPQQKEIMTELGKQQINRDGSDYYLQTEQDMSEPDQTDFGGDGHDSDNDEDDISFEDDSSSATNSSVTTTTTTSSISTNQQPPLLSRKTSNLSEKDLSSTSLNDFKSPSTAAGLHKATGSTSALEEAKLKKYKKKLKAMKLELEKSKAEKDEAKKLYDEMEKIKERTKQVGDHHTSEYVNKIETLTKNNQELDGQVNNLRSQSTKDSNEIINLQNQIIHLGSQLDNLNQENSTLNDNIRVLEDKVNLTGSSKVEEESDDDDDEQLSLMRVELTQAQGTIEHLNFEMVQVKGTLQQAQEENRNHFIQLEQERLKSNSNESNAARVTQENNNLKQQIDHSDKTIHLQIDEFEKEKLLLTNEINILKDNNSKLKEQFETQQDNISSNSTSANTTVTLLEEEIKNLQTQLNDKDQEIELMLQSHEIKLREIDQESKVELDNKDQEIEKVQLEFNKSQQELSEKLKIELEKDEEIEKLRKELDDNINNSSNNNSSSEAELTKLREQLEEAESRLNSQEILTQETSDKVESLQSKLFDKDQEIEILKSQQVQESDNTASEIDSKDGEILELSMKFENEKIDLQNEIQKLQLSEHENTKLKTQILEYQMDSNSKQNILNEYQALMSKLQIELDESNSKKEELNEELLKVKNEFEESKHNNNNNQNSNNNEDKDKDENENDDSDSDNEKNKIKKLKSKIKKLKEEMEDKDDEWIDAKVQYEEEIQELKENNGDLEQTVKELRANVTVVPVILDNENDNENENIIKDLQVKLQESREELEQEKLKTQTLEDEIDKLQQVYDNEISTLQQSISTPVLINNNSSNPSSPNLLSNDSMNDIKKELEENKNIESSVYWSEIDYDRNNVPYCGSSVWSLIQSIGGISQPQNQRLLSKIIVSLEKSFLRSGNDCKFICYWLATLSHLLHKLHQIGLTQELSDPSKSGIEISISSFIQPSSELGGNFVRDLQSLLLNIYSKLISIIEIRIEKVLISSIFLPDSLILTTTGNNTPIKSFSSPLSTKSISSPSTPLSKSSSSKDSSSGHSINNLLSILDNVIQFLKESKIPDVISNQLLNQTFYFINSQITNYLLTNPKVCTSTQGLEVKMGVSRLKEWCSQTNFKSASQQLDSSHEASNLLVIDKNVFVDVEAIKSIFSKLNLHQIRVLLQSYEPDDLSPESLPSALKVAMDNNWRQPKDINSLPLQIDSSLKIKSNK